jgi:hypothetical protein
VNEAGVIMNLEDNKEAEALLRHLLERNEESLSPIEDKLISYCYLRTAKNPDKESIDAVEAFKSNPENQELVKIAEEKIKEFASKNN